MTGIKQQCWQVARDHSEEPRTSNGQPDLIISDIHCLVNKCALGDKGLGTKEKQKDKDSGYARSPHIFTSWQAQHTYSTGTFSSKYTNCTENIENTSLAIFSTGSKCIYIITCHVAVFMPLTNPRLPRAVHTTRYTTLSGRILHDIPRHLTFELDHVRKWMYNHVKWFSHNFIHFLVCMYMCGPA